MPLHFLNFHGLPECAIAFTLFAHKHEAKLYVVNAYNSTRLGVSKAIQAFGNKVNI